MTCPLCKDQGYQEFEDTHDTDIYPCRCQEDEPMIDTNPPAPADQIAPDGREEAMRALADVLREVMSLTIVSVDHYASLVDSRLAERGYTVSAIVPDADPDPKRALYIFDGDAGDNRLYVEGECVDGPRSSSAREEMDDGLACRDYP